MAAKRAKVNLEFRLVKAADADGDAKLSSDFATASTSSSPEGSGAAAFPNS
jgi:hypothetical protein